MNISIFGLGYVGAVSLDCLAREGAETGAAVKSWAAATVAAVRARMGVDLIEFIGMELIMFVFSLN